MFRSDLPWRNRIAIAAILLAELALLFSLAWDAANAAAPDGPFPLCYQVAGRTVTVLGRTPDGAGWVVDYPHSTGVVERLTVDPSALTPYPALPCGLPKYQGDIRLVVVLASGATEEVSGAATSVPPTAVPLSGLATQPAPTPAEPTVEPIAEVAATATPTAAPAATGTEPTPPLWSGRLFNFAVAVAALFAIAAVIATASALRGYGGRRPPDPEPEAKGAGPRRCPQCGSFVAKKATSCKRCGATIT